MLSSCIGEVLAHPPSGPSQPGRHLCPRHSTFVGFLGSRVYTTSWRREGIFAGRIRFFSTGPPGLGLTCLQAQFELECGVRMAAKAWPMSFRPARGVKTVYAVFCP